MNVEERGTTVAVALAAMRLPLIVAPMTAVSGPELVKASVRAGVMGSFPTGNCTSVGELDDWLSEIAAVVPNEDGWGKVAPVAVNLIIRGNRRLEAEIELIGRHRVPIVITSVGSPAAVVAPLHELGVSVFADVASMRHATKALEEGADGLILLSAGAGGHTGWANPFAFVRAVRAEYSGPVVMAGGISDGIALRAAQALGCDLGYMGTAFIATQESSASAEYKHLLLTATLDDVELTMAANGVAASTIKGKRASAGHSVSGVTDVLPVADLVERTFLEWSNAAPAGGSGLPHS